MMCERCGVHSPDNAISCYLCCAKQDHASEMNLTTQGFVNKVNEIFRFDCIGSFDFSHMPLILSRSNIDNERPDKCKERDFLEWKRMQQEFIDWVNHRNDESIDKMKSTKESFDNFFQHNGFLKGNVIDIGGGWGLWREYWSSDDGIFLVHDPGIERILDGPSQSIYNVFSKAFMKPMVCVTGYGEELPYRDEEFDYCIIAAALDHCINPLRVIEEGRRCLVSGGQMFIVSVCEMSSILRYPIRARGFIRNINASLRGQEHPDHHIHHFTKDGLFKMLEKAGFRGESIDIRILDRSKSTFLFKATKK